MDRRRRRMRIERSYNFSIRIYGDYSSLMICQRKQFASNCEENEKKSPSKYMEILSTHVSRTVDSLALLFSNLDPRLPRFRLAYSILGCSRWSRIFCRSTTFLALERGSTPDARKCIQVTKVGWCGRRGPAHRSPHSYTIEPKSNSFELNIMTNVYVRIVMSP